MPASSAFLQNWLEPLLGRWLYADSMLWTVVGFLGAAIFGSRFILQWLKSEKERKLVVPWYFWHLSFWGSVLNVLYFLHLDKAPLILGNCFLPFLYGRNILFLRRAGTKGGGRKVFAAVLALVLAGFAWSAFVGDERTDVKGSANESTKDLMQQAAAALKAHHQEHRRFPEGDTRAIEEALTKGRYITEPSSGLGADGQWLDHWKHPIQIFTSGNTFLIRSAGQNGIFDDSLGNSSDDIIVQGAVP